MHFKPILYLSISLFSTIVSSATIEKRCGLKREPITMKDGLAYGQVKVGTPSKSFSILFDTSQSLTWVPSIDCHTPICRKHDDLYDPSSSSTSKNLHKKESIKYSEGVCVDTRLYQDSISVAGIKVKDQLFGAAYSVKGLGANDYLGYLGLGGYSENGDVQLSYNSTGLQKRGRPNGAYASNAFMSGYARGSQQFGMVSSRQSGFYQKRSNVGDEHNAEFIIGGVDHNLYKGDMAYFKLPTCDYGNSPYWKTELKCVKLGKVDIKLSSKTLASFDSGSSHILAPIKQADLLHTAIGGYYDQDDGVYKIKNCEHLDSFPTLKFDFNNYRVSLPSKAYLVKKNGECTSLIGRTLDDKNWSLGGYFSRWFYQVFDVSNLQIGLAIPNDGCDVKIEKI